MNDKLTSTGFFPRRKFIDKISVNDRSVVYFYWPIHRMLNFDGTKSLSAISAYGEYLLA